MALNGLRSVSEITQTWCRHPEIGQTDPDAAVPLDANRPIRSSPTSPPHSMPIECADGAQRSLQRMTPPCSTAASPARCASRRPPKRSRRSCASPSSTVRPWSPVAQAPASPVARSAGAARRGVDRPDEQGAVGRYQQPHRLGATRRHQSRPLEEAAAQGFHFAPDPSSQQVCTLGGNVANNSGGPHCLAYGVTDAHVVSLEVVLPDGRSPCSAAPRTRPPASTSRRIRRQRGHARDRHKIGVRITPNAPAVRTLLLSFATVRDAAQTVSDIIAAGVVPAALEVMDQRMTVAVENYVAAGYPTDAAAVLLAEVEGLEGGVEIDAARIEELGRANSATDVRLAGSEEERAALWKGRKTAFGAVAQIARLLPARHRRSRPSLPTSSSRSTRSPTAMRSR